MLRIKSVWSIQTFAVHNTFKGWGGVVTRFENLVLRLGPDCTHTHTHTHTYIQTDGDYTKRVVETLRDHTLKNGASRLVFIQRVCKKDRCCPPAVISAPGHDW